jgi:glycosyltransferase involved in cell wall biosynthesis
MTEPAGDRGADVPAGTRVALVHDWLTGMRGGERVLEVLCDLYPQAELFTLVYRPGGVSPTIERHRIHRSFVQYLPRAARWYRYYLPLFPMAVEQFDLDRFDLVVSTSHCAAKAAVKVGRARHLCYCLTPMRYAWDQFDLYFGPARVGAVASRLFKVVLGWLARWDAETAARVDRFVAISEHVARRIRRYYNRRASVIYPPVDTRFYHGDGTPPDRYFLTVSALVPYKRVDVVIEACRRVGAPLKIVGEGPERARLERLAGPEVEFLGRRPATYLRELYRRAAAFVLAAEEDFGIAPVEAQACGRPVVALARGGTAETVIDGVTGVLVAEPTPAAFAEGLARIRHTRFDAAAIRAHALKFSRERFVTALRACLAETLTGSTPWSSANSAC